MDEFYGIDDATEEFEMRRHRALEQKIADADSFYLQAIGQSDRGDQAGDKRGDDTGLSPARTPSRERRRRSPLLTISDVRGKGKGKSSAGGLGGGMGGGGSSALTARQQAKARLVRSETVNKEIGKEGLKASFPSVWSKWTSPAWEARTSAAWGGMGYRYDVT